MMMGVVYPRIISSCTGPWADFEKVEDINFVITPLNTRTLVLAGDLTSSSSSEDPPRLL